MIVTMPIYSVTLTAPPNDSDEKDIEVQGHYITYVSLRFPPGSMGLLKVGIFYGIKKIFPSDEDQWFQGDDEVIAWQEWYELPESPCKLRIVAINDDDTYEHSVLVRIATISYEADLARRIAKSIISMIRRLLGVIE